MSTMPRERVFGAKATATPRPSPRPLAPVELRYSPGKLIVWTLVCVGFVVITVCIISDGGLGADYHGRDAGLVHLLGPRGTIALFALFGAGCALLAFSNLRILLGGDPVAVSAKPDGLHVNGVWGRRNHEWTDVSAIRLQLTRTRSSEIAFIKIERLTGRDQLIATRTIAGGRPTVDTWIRDAQIYLRR